MKISIVRAEVLLRVTAIVLALMLKTASGQTMATADTLGKGELAYFATTNALIVKDFTTLNITIVQGCYGLNNRADIFVGASDTTVFGKHQVAGIFGSNITMLKSSVLSISTLHTLSVPITRRAEGTPLWLASLIASRNMGKIVGYVGYSANVPIGKTVGKLFTPADVIHNIPIGIAIPKGKWIWLAEYNFGKTVQTVGIGISWTP